MRTRERPKRLLPPRYGTGNAVGVGAELERETRRQNAGSEDEAVDARHHDA